MELVVCLLRPKPNTVLSQVFHPQVYDILLLDRNIPQKTGFIVAKQLPGKTLSYEQDTTEEILNFLYEFTGFDRGGIKGKRAVFVPQTKAESYTETERSTKAVLYCIPIDSNDKLSNSMMTRLPYSPVFHSLDLVLESLNTNTMVFTPQTLVMLKRLKSWLREKHMMHYAIELLFSVPAEERLKRSITSPAHLSEGLRTSVSRQFSDDGNLRETANEVHSRMFELDQCDYTLFNPLLGAEGILYRPKVDHVVVNKYWGLGTPNYSLVAGLKKPDYVGPRLALLDSQWAEDFPLHKAALDGNVDAVRRLLKEEHKGYKQDSESWTPLHYASWYGHLSVLTTLLTDAGVSPNVTNKLQCTPLHLAAANAQVYAVELLLNHPDTDRLLKNSHARTALNICESEDSAEWRSCAKLLLQPTKQQKLPTIQVSLMDGSYHTLDLVNRADTSVSQLHQQMMKELKLPENCAHFFAIWVCSQSLQLQLKPEHRPIEHLQNWKQKTVVLFTDQNPREEEPQLVWRRDVILSLESEKVMKHETAIRLLFHEAYSNYLESLYPCSDQDVIVLGGILLQLYTGNCDSKKLKKGISERALQNLVPASKLVNKSINWVSKIQAQYKHYSDVIRERAHSKYPQTADVNINVTLTPHILQLHFLAVCWNLKVYGSAFFTGHLQPKANARSPTMVFIGVNDVGLHIISANSRQLLYTLSYPDIEWGPYKKNQPMLQVTVKKDATIITILTKQAGLINHLMTKICELRQTLPST